MANPVGYSLDHVLVQYYQLEQAKVTAKEALEAAAEAREAAENADRARGLVPEGAADDSKEKGDVNSKAVMAADKVRKAADKAIAAMNAADGVLAANQLLDPDQAPPQVVAMARAAAHEALTAAQQAQAAAAAAADAGQGERNHANTLKSLGGAEEKVGFAREQFDKLGEVVQQPVELPPIFPTPMLCLSRTAEGEERLIVCQDKQEVPWYYRLLAFFGLGHASLNSVAAHLRGHQREIHVFDPSATHESAILVDRAVQWVNEKMILRNQGSRIQHLDPLTLVSPVVLRQEDCVGAVGSTVPEDLVVEHTPDTQGQISEEFHNLDNFLVYPERGMFVLGDATGHHEDRMNRINAFESLWQHIPRVVDQLPPPHTLVEAIRSLENAVKMVNQDSLDRADRGERTITSSLIIAWIIRDNEGQSYLVYAAVGDANLYLLSQEGNLRQITPGKGAYRECEIGGQCPSPLVDVIQVKPGDKIFAMTDGIHGYMTNRMIEQIARQVPLEELCSELTRAVMDLPLDELVPEHEQIEVGTKIRYIPGEVACLDPEMERDPANAKQPYQPRKETDGSFNQHGCDDTGVVGMIVPELD